jgi:hypothetical protein
LRSGTDHASSTARKRKSAESTPAQALGPVRAAAGSTAGGTTRTGIAGEAASTAARQYSEATQISSK